ncbi:hypothetical protein [Streptomyces sp. NPDC048349]|uniref:hypothetical protein n=1 Tax=Streptomyces sp. NPDC048349 TaxID=3155486 RepID=UPI00341F1CCC
MTGCTVPHCAHGVLSLDTPERLTAGVVARHEPSAELLDRALVGWERFIGGLEGTCDD